MNPLLAGDAVNPPLAGDAVNPLLAGDAWLFEDGEGEVSEIRLVDI